MLHAPALELRAWAAEEAVVSLLYGRHISAAAPVCDGRNRDDHDRDDVDVPIPCAHVRDVFYRSHG